MVSTVLGLQFVPTRRRGVQPVWRSRVAAKAARDVAAEVQACSGGGSGQMSRARGGAQCGACLSSGLGRPF